MADEQVERLEGWWVFHGKATVAHYLRSDGYNVVPTREAGPIGDSQGHAHCSVIGACNYLRLGQRLPDWGLDKDDPLDAVADLLVSQAQRIASLTAENHRALEALRRIESIEGRADDVRGSGMVDYADTKAMRAMANLARAALAAQQSAPTSSSLSSENPGDKT